MKYLELNIYRKFKFSINGWFMPFFGLGFKTLIIPGFSQSDPFVESLAAPLIHIKVP